MGKAESHPILNAPVSGKKNALQPLGQGHVPQPSLGGKGFQAGASLEDPHAITSSPQILNKANLKKNTV